jgi:hypothetical protein
VGVGKKTARKRAVGTRERIVAYLTEVTELFDANGMASTQLAAAVGYPGSSVAFAQLLSGMDRSGLIEREVRGKRTYRISLGPAHAIGSGGGIRASAVPGVAMAAGVHGIGGGIGAGGVGGEAGSNGVDIGAAGFDYDELARRLLVQVVRRLAAAEPEASHSSPDRPVPDPDRSVPDRSVPDRSVPDRSVPNPDRSVPDRSVLQETVSGLEYELAAAWTKHGKLAEENVRLREQLRAAQRSLALAAERVRRLSVSTDLDRSEVVLLQRLLASANSGDPGGDGSGTGDADREAEGLDEARSVLS